MSVTELLVQVTLMNYQSKRDYLALLRTRYQLCITRKEKGLIIDEALVNLGCARKSIIRALHTIPRERSSHVRGRKEAYGYDLIAPLKKLWEVSGYPCSQRLKPQIPELIAVLTKFHELTLYPGQQEKLIKMSSFTIDKLLSFERLHHANHGLSGTKKSPLLKTLIPVRTEFNDVHEAGHIEMDCILHCGNSLSGTFAETLNLLDIHTHWNEKMIFLKKTHEKVIGAFHMLRKQFPFSVESIDFDNGYEFVNWAMHAYCKREGISFTRSRSYHKNDQAHIEGKNFQSVRRVIGYGRIETTEVVALVNDIYQNEHRLLTNFFYPTFKLKAKTRIGGKTKKSYETPLTPYQRVLASEVVPGRVKDQLRAQYRTLNPAQLQRSLQNKLAKLQDLIG